MAFTTWSTTDKSASLTLSGGNLIATAGAGSQGVRGAHPKRTGKYYVEYTSTTVQSSSSTVGFATAATTLTLGQNACAVCQSTSTSHAWDTFSNQAVNGTGASFTTGTVIGCAVDLDNALIWWRQSPAGNWNNLAPNNPATGVGGLDMSATGVGRGIDAYPFASLINLNNSITANFGATAFSGAVPAGFTSGWDDSVAIVTNAIASQALAEHWLTTNPDARITQVSLEHWQSVASGNLQAVVTFVALEHWTSVAVVVPAAGGPMVTMIH